MLDTPNYITREPLLDIKGRIAGYALSWRPPTDAAIDPNREDPNSLALAIASEYADEEQGWKLTDTTLFIEVIPLALPDEVLESLPPSHTVFSLSSSALSDPDTLASVTALREKGFGISLKHADLTVQNKGYLPLLTHMEVRFGAADMATQTKLYGTLRQSSIKMVSREVKTWEEYEACVSLGVDAFVGTIYLTPRKDHVSQGLNPAQTMIMQLMQLVRQNADVRKLEDVLRRDAALSYKLLRYINSAGFGLGTEIQSLRHAVTMLGYSPLYRWLSLLLATATAGGGASILMQTAVVRGRLTELLAQGYVAKSEAENLFVAGMFSLLDRLLGLSMEEVLENIQLSEPICQALLSREGEYGPFLALAEACETGNGDVAERAEALFIDAAHVNQAHLAALAWAQSLKL
ncbi:MAG: hypothetical protein K0S28_284 [Paucimonas sp.]|jgi:EAL and modified HD-GYP domain-containing signal transduction protein|nr:hypothetical protein [Paucimonas sp.]